MMRAVRNSFVGLIVLFTSVHSLPQREVSSEVNLTPTFLSRTSEEQCYRNNKKGICVHESFCNEGHEIMPGGIIEDSEFRERNPTRQCNSEFDWCCTQTVDEPRVITKTKHECTSPDPHDCPWCVSLYKNSTSQAAKTGLFCMGSMIGDKVILTASTCIIQAQRQILWARVPSSKYPRQNYTVRYRYINPNYNSGSHGYDYGLLVLESEVKWKDDFWKGACLGLGNIKTNICLAYGFDINESYESTILKVDPGSCFRNAGNASDAMCGEVYDESDGCFVTTGSPVICSVQGTHLLIGVARSSCFNENKAILGKLSQASDWLESVFRRLDLPKSLYIKESTNYILRSRH